jgi:hypothetical protein
MPSQSFFLSLIVILLAIFSGIYAKDNKKAVKKQNDATDHKGLTPFFLQDPTDQMCLGPNGFTVCDENALWLLTRRTGKKTYSLVSFLHPQTTACLTKQTSFFGLLGSDKLTLGSCNSNAAKGWKWDFVDQSHIKLSNNGLCLVRGKKNMKNSISLQNCNKEEHVTLLYHPTAVHENGFYIKAADGTCFDGQKFRSCTGAGANKLLWGMGLKYVWGEPKKYLFNFALSERSNCIVAKGNKVGVDSCSSKNALTWSISNGQLTYKHGSLCVARGNNDEAFLTKCVNGYEYLSVEVPSLYTNEELAEMLESQASEHGISL